MARAMTKPVVHPVTYRMTHPIFFFLSEALVDLVYLEYCSGEFGTMIVCYRKIGTVYYKHTNS